MKKLLVGISLCCSAMSGYSQRPDTSLKTLLSKPDDTLKVDLLYKYSVTIRDSNANDALKVAEVAKVIAEKLKFRKGLAPILENMGWIIYRRGNFAKALIYANEANKIYTELGNKRGIASCTNNFSAILTEQKRYDESVKLLKRALALAEEIKDYQIMARCATNIALGFLPMGKLDSAQYFTELSIKYGTIAKDQYRIAFDNRTLGDIYLEKNEFDTAQKFFFEALIPTDKGGNVFLEASTLYRIARTYFLKKEYDLALKYLEGNKAIAEKFEFKSELEKTYKLMADIYRAKKDNAKVVFYQDKYSLVHDSLVIQRSNEQMALKFAKFESEIQQAQIDLLKKDAQLKEDEIKRHEFLTYAFIAGILFLFMVGLALFFGNKRMISINEELRESNRKINEQALQLRELNATKDKIFSIIGHDLRGPLASLRGLMGLVSGSNISQEEFVHFSKNLKNNLDFVSDDLDNLLHWARAQSRSIEPNFEVCNPRQIVHELHQLYEESARAKNLILENKISDGIEIFADLNHLKLILRNLIGNSIKFSHHGGLITTSGQINNGVAALSVTDRGKGMSPDEVEKLFFIGTHFTKPGTNNEKGMGIGLILVKEFVEKNNGYISVISELGKGSTFSVSFQNHRNTTQV